jgi:serine/threonine protein kinase
MKPLLCMFEEGSWHFAAQINFCSSKHLHKGLMWVSYGNSQASKDLATAMLVHQVASGMTYLHSRTPAPVLHGDLKTANLLLENDGLSIVIADFGLAGWLKGVGGPISQAAQAGAHTVIISPPEVRKGKGCTIPRASP